MHLKSIRVKQVSLSAVPPQLTPTKLRKGKRTMACLVSGHLEAQIRFVNRITMLWGAESTAEFKERYLVG